MQFRSGCYDQSTSKRGITLVDLPTIMKRMRLAEWLTIAVTAVCQSFWILGISKIDGHYLLSLTCLVLAAALVVIIPQKSSGRAAAIIYSLQGILYSVAAATGNYRLYGLLFMALTIKTALFCNTKTTISLVAFYFVAHAAAHIIALNFYQNHLHASVKDGPTFLLIYFLEAQLLAATAYTAIVLLTRATVAERTSRRKANRLSQEVETMAVAVERGRIVRDIHDGVGHSLTSLNIQLELTAKLLEKRQDEQAGQSLAVARQTAAAALTDLRRALKTIKNEEINLADAVDSIAHNIAEQGQISFDIVIDDAALSTAARQNLLLIVKECITNIQKHSAATLVQIHLAALAGKAELLVSDNGRGFKDIEDNDGLGIRGMHDRVAALGGTFNIISTPGGGTRVLVSLPT